MKWITATDLETWANSIQAESSFPELIGDLIRSSAEVKEYRFLGGNKSRVRGFDGRLSANSTSPFVPSGESIWEFGVGENFQKKVEVDYNKRTKELSEDDRMRTTFVFATPRTWDNPKQNIQSWLNGKRTANQWKDVRFLDGVQIETWLETSPAVSARYAKTELGSKPLSGARSSEEFWLEFSARFERPLTEDVLLCQRESEATAVLDRLSGQTGEILVRADSPDEVLAFVIAAIRKTEPDQQCHLESRILIVESEDAARFALTIPGLIILPRAQARNLSGALCNRFPTIIALGRDAPARKGQIPLTRPSRHALASAIESMGFDPARAADLARTSGQSVTILARRIPNGDAGIPEWAKDGPILLPALLAGAWDTELNVDKDALTQLSGKPLYSEYEATLTPLRRLHDPPIDVEGSIWKIRAPVDAFVHIGSLVTPSILDRLKTVVKCVFSDIDQSLDEPRERFSEKTPLRHSPWLRQGLATTLLHLAVLSEEADLPIDRYKAQRFVDDLINDLPGLHADHRLIASLRAELPYLMEAAPDPLLSALDQLVEGNGDAAKPLFRESGFLGPSSPHIEILWALETLAWDPDYLSRVALLLAKLARIDPSVNTSNRPVNSLREIFLPWNPSTNALLSQRCAALDLILKCEPDVGWELLVSLLPTIHDTSSGTRKPLLRESGGSSRPTRTRASVTEAYHEVISRAVNFAAGIGTRWKAIVQNIGNMRRIDRTSVLNALDIFLQTSTAEEHYDVWSELREEVSRHKAHETAAWALQADELIAIESLVARYEPKDSIRRIIWLFDDYLPEIANTENRRDTIDNLRREAVQSIYKNLGVQGIVTLAKKARLPQFVAIAAAQSVTVSEEVDDFIDTILDTEPSLAHFASILSAEYSRRNWNDWSQSILFRAQSKRWSDQQIASLVVFAEDSKSTWDFVSKLGDRAEALYWSQKRAWPVTGDNNLIEYAVSKYLSVGRAMAAIEAFSERLSALPIQLVFTALDKAIEELANAEVKPSTMFIHDLTEILDALIQRNDVPRVEIAKREFQFLPLFGYGERVLVLHQLMADSPQLFIDFITSVFKARSQSKDDKTPTENEIARAKIAYRVLQSFHSIPGCTDENIDRQTLTSWITDARHIATSVDRIRVSDQYIGHLLAHSPVDSSDGAWPHIVIREIIEHLASDDIERGISTERFNMRGVYSKDPYEGGDQERALAKQYSDWQTAAGRWPRLAYLLGQIAKDYEVDANAEDIRANQRKMRD